MMRKEVKIEKLNLEITSNTNAGRTYCVLLHITIHIKEHVT